MDAPERGGTPSMGVGGSEVRIFIFGLPSADGVPRGEAAGECSRGGREEKGGGDPAVEGSCLMLGPVKLPLPGILRVILAIFSCCFKTE
jgi:hypothetical protein